MKIENDKTLKGSYAQLRMLEESLKEHNRVKASMVLHPQLIQAQRDSLVGMIESVKEDINDYELQRAIDRFYATEQHMWGLKAFKRGWQAAREGKPQDDCPYVVQRQTVTGWKTFGHAYKERWLAGYNSYMHHRPEAALNGALA
jgi:ribosome modulation factor